MYQLVLMLVMLCSCNHKQNTNVVDSNIIKNNEITAPIKEALERLALVTPKIADDSVSDDMAAYVVALSDSMDNAPFDMYDAMLDIYTMQTAVAYGLAYFPSMMSLYIDAEAGGDGLCIMDVWNHFKDTRANEDGLEWLSRMSIYSLYNYTLYFKAYNTMTRDEVFNHSQHNFTLYHVQLCIENLYELCPSDTVAYQYSCVMEGTAFFVTFCPMIQKICPQEVYERDMHEQVMASAAWFDAKADVVKNAIATGVVPTKMTEEEFFLYMKEATRRKVQIIDFLTTAIIELDKEENGTEGDDKK